MVFRTREDGLVRIPRPACADACGRQEAHRRAAPGVCCLRKASRSSDGPLFVGFVQNYRNSNCRVERLDRGTVWDAEQGIAHTHFIVGQSFSFVANQYCGWLSPVPPIDGVDGRWRRSDNVDLRFLQGLNRLLQIDIPDMRHAKHTASACTYGFGIEHTRGFRGSNAPRSAERFGNPENRSNVA